jgi:hypothetical protein
MTRVDESLQLTEDVSQLGAVVGTHIDDIVDSLPTDLMGCTIALRVRDRVPAHIARIAIADYLLLGHRSLT